MKKGFFAPVILLAITITLFGACASEEETVGGGSGEKVTVRFTVSEEPFGATETVTSRGTSSSGASSSEEKVVEEKLVPVGGNLYARTKLIEHTPAATRATTAFTGKLRILAYKVGVLTFRTDYTVTNGTLSDPTNVINNLGTETDTYDFVAYAYNGEELPPPLSNSIIFNQTNHHDLLYWRGEQTLKQGEENNVSIKLTHKFAKVQVKVSTTKLVDADHPTPNIEAITVQLPTGYAQSTLTISSGEFTAKSGTRQLSFPTSELSPAKTTVESDFAYVLPTADNAQLQLKVYPLTITGFPDNLGMENNTQIPNTYYGGA